MSSPPSASPSPEDHPPPTLLPPSAAASPIPDVASPVASPPAPPLAPLPSLLLTPPAPSPDTTPEVMPLPPLPSALPPSSPSVVVPPPASTPAPRVPADSPPAEAPPRMTGKPHPVSWGQHQPALPRTHSSKSPTPVVSTRKPQPPPDLPSTPEEPSTKPLPTDPLSPASSLNPPATPTTVFPTPTTSTATPSSDEPFFPELSLPPPGAQNSPPLAPELLNGSMPLTTAASGQTDQHAVEEPHQSAGLVSGLAVGGALLILVTVFVMFVYRRGKGKELRKTRKQSSGVKVRRDEVSSNNSHAVIAIQPPVDHASSSMIGFSSGSFTYDELVRATGNFSAANLLGEGGFGYVHKGVISGGKEIAAKQLKVGSHQGEREFRAELETISRVHHKHLVTLLGYCITGSARFLIYEFVPNNTLEFHLHGDGQPVMDWPTRLRIAIGSAKGLAYLHEDCSPTIIHRDIKAANILLDFKFEAKVSDFGLAKFFTDTNSHVTHISTRVVGTFGYLAPEYASSGKLTEKSDVYSYGIMLLELITGRTPITRTETVNEALVDWARPLLPRAIETGDSSPIVDPRLQDNYDSNQMARMIECAAACIRHSAWLRPRMSQIVRAMEENEPLTDLEEGNTAAHSRLYSSLDIKRLTMALTSPDYGRSQRSENTSEYGLFPSGSSSEAHHTR